MKILGLEAFLEAFSHHLGGKMIFVYCRKQEKWLSGHTPNYGASVDWHVLFNKGSYDRLLAASAYDLRVLKPQLFQCSGWVKRGRKGKCGAIVACRWPSASWCWETYDSTVACKIGFATLSLKKILSTDHVLVPQHNRLGCGLTIVAVSDCYLRFSLHNMINSGVVWWSSTMSAVLQRNLSV